MRSIFFGASDKRVHLAVFGRYVDVLVFHYYPLFAALDPETGCHHAPEALSNPHCPLDSPGTHELDGKFA